VVAVREEIAGALVGVWVGAREAARAGALGADLELEAPPLRGMLAVQATLVNAPPCIWPWDSIHDRACALSTSRLVYSTNSPRRMSSSCTDAGSNLINRCLIENWEGDSLILLAVRNSLLTRNSTPCDGSYRMASYSLVARVAVADVTNRLCMVQIMGVNSCAMSLSRSVGSISVSNQSNA
jgi:hypothetical protein